MLIQSSIIFYKKKKIINLENISKENISRRNDDEDVNGLLLCERLG